jgi:ureidoacrylate peracid hydrolase
MNEIAAIAQIADPAHTALVVVDVQNDFCNPEEYPAAQLMLPRLRAFIEDARRQDVRVVYARVVHSDLTDSEVWRARNRNRPNSRGVCREGSVGAEYAPGFGPLPGDVEIVKHRYSAFVGTELELVLRAQGIRTVLVTGIATNTCVESTARDAYQRDFHVILVSDCTACKLPMLQEATEENIRRNFGLVATADEVVAAWQPVAV